MNTTKHITSKDAKPRDHDHYPTAPEDVEKCLRLVKGFSIPTILDIGCGNGVWGEVAKKEIADVGGCCTQITGIDIQEFKKNSSYDVWYNKTDFFKWHNQIIEYETFNKYRLIIGNPPFKHAQAMIKTCVS
jgi:16S rRNA G1207 methylase RsmC